MLIYKIAPHGDWAAAKAAGRYDGSPDDKRDGFIHFSTAPQLPGTAAKYYAGKPDHVLIAFDGEGLGDDLKWEPSRGGALFPHLYGTLDPALALWEKPLPLGADGLPILPDLAGA